MHIECSFIPVTIELITVVMITLTNITVIKLVVTMYKEPEPTFIYLITSDKFCHVLGFVCRIITTLSIIMTLLFSTFGKYSCKPLFIKIKNLHLVKIRFQNSNNV